MDIKANKQKLAVGILLDSFLVSAWFYRAIERIVTSDFADITFIVLNTAKETLIKTNCIKYGTNEKILFIFYYEE